MIDQTNNYIFYCVRNQSMEIYCLQFQSSHQHHNSTSLLLHTCIVYCLLYWYHHVNPLKTSKCFVFSYCCLVQLHCNALQWFYQWNFLSISLFVVENNQISFLLGFYFKKLQLFEIWYSKLWELTKIFKQKW